MAKTNFKNVLPHKLFLIALFFLAISRSHAEDHKTLPIGSVAPDFSLPDVSGRMVSLADFRKAKVLVIVFTCNHCPTAQAYEDRIIKLTDDYAPKQVSVVAIMPNDPASLRLDELDFSDLGDSYEDMKIRAREKKFNFPYLYDGKTQQTSLAYGPVATPHVFIFDQDRKLRYTGRFDDMESPFKKPNSNDARDAIEALLNGKEIAVPKTKTFGCSVKWSEKKEQVAKALEKWAREPVSIDQQDGAGLARLLQNSSEKLRLVNIWSTTNAPSKEEFHEFITMNRMYRDRDFEFISICIDLPENKDMALQFLQKEQASNTNYLIAPKEQQAFAGFVGSLWSGKLPFTMLVEPGGKIVYSREGTIDPSVMKKTIVNNHLIGKYP